MTQDHRPLRAACWMMGSVIAFLLMAIAGRQVSGTHDTFEIMTWRSLIGFIIISVVILASGDLRQIKTDRLPRHLMRNTAHFAGQNLWFWALTMIPLAQVFALEFTAPIWVILLAPLFLGETLTRTKLLAALLGFSGTLIVAQPGFGHIDPGVLAAAAAAVCFAVTAIFTKTLTRHESILSIMFWLTGMQLVMGSVMALQDGAMQWPTAQTAPWLLLIGLCGLTAHFCLTTALSLAPASTVVPVDFIRLPLAALLGWLLYGEILGLEVYAGASLILGGVWLNLRGTMRAVRPQKSA
jgi:drug/metabolite transporter (DMT)-like permease